MAETSQGESFLQCKVYSRCVTLIHKSVETARDCWRQLEVREPVLIREEDGFQVPDFHCAPRFCYKIEGGKGWVKTDQSCDVIWNIPDPRV